MVSVGRKSNAQNHAETRRGGNANNVGTRCGGKAMKAVMRQQGLEINNGNTRRDGNALGEIMKRHSGRMGRRRVRRGGNAAGRVVTLLDGKTTVVRAPVVYCIQLWARHGGIGMVLLLIINPMLMV